ncbi:MAG: hypothetical protein KAJ16_09180, partial [Calditrichia bacterium]|nr:hypothetical protein [Calditrichia bacterium]
ALKNLSVEKETNPPVVQNIVERVRKSGSTVSLTDLAQKRRAELDLPPYKMDCVDEVEKLLKE